jgi:hypothetical protein
MVIVLLETVATEERLDVYDIGNPEDDVAVSVIGASPKVAVASAVNVIVCVALFTVKLTSTGVAAR